MITFQVKELIPPFFFSNTKISIKKRGFSKIKIEFRKKFIISLWGNSI